MARTTVGYTNTMGLTRANLGVCLKKTMDFFVSEAKKGIDVVDAGKGFVLTVEVSVEA